MPDPVLSPADRLVAALLLTMIGGFVDAVGYIALYQIFTANMSGNSIHIGMGAGNHDMQTLARFSCALVSYVVAMVLTRIALEVAARSQWRRIASITLGVEALLLLAFAHATPAMRDGHLASQYSLFYFAMLAVLAFAMGVQTATLTHFGPLTVYTTFVTGTLTKFAEAFTRLLFWAHDARESGKSLSVVLRTLVQQADAIASFFLLGIWICYVIGAALGTISKRQWELHALYCPVAVLGCLMLLDLVHPISKREESRQNTGPNQLKM